MGLDMYLLSVPKIDGMDLQEILTANIYLHKHEKEQTEIYEKIKPHIKYFEEFGHSWYSLRAEIACWRKANFVHHWFVEHVQNGEDDMSSYEVTKGNLQELYTLCLNVLSRKNPPYASLPTRPGPFFGNTSYDDFYYFEVDRTKILLQDLLENFNFESHYMLYHANW